MGGTSAGFGREVVASVDNISFFGGDISFAAATCVLNEAILAPVEGEGGRFIGEGAPPPDKEMLVIALSGVTLVTGVGEGGWGVAVFAFRAFRAVLSIDRFCCLAAASAGSKVFSIINRCCILTAGSEVDAIIACS